MTPFAQTADIKIHAVMIIKNIAFQQPEEYNTRMSKDRLQPVDQEQARILLQEHLSRAADMLALPKDELPQFSDYARLTQEVLAAIRFDPSENYSWRGYNGQPTHIAKQAGVVTLNEINHQGGSASSMLLWNVSGRNMVGYRSGIHDEPHYTPVNVNGECYTNIFPITIEIARFTGVYEGSLAMIKSVKLGQIGVNEGVEKLGLTPLDRLIIDERAVFPDGRVIFAPTYNPLSS